MDLYFIRHGKTEWNLEGRLQGRTGDSPLLPESYEQIERVAKALATIPFAKIYCSPSLRARKTAQVIYSQLEMPCEIVLSEGLREFGLGELEGVTITEATKRYPLEMDAFRNDLSKYDPYPYKGETITSILERMERVVMSATYANDTDQPILFVSHGAALTACINHLAGRVLNELRSQGGLNNNTVSILETQDKRLPFYLKEWNKAY
jgi:probable phosphoglycerate mutase